MNMFFGKEENKYINKPRERPESWEIYFKCLIDSNCKGVCLSKVRKYFTVPIPANTDQILKIISCILMKMALFQTSFCSCEIGVLIYMRETILFYFNFIFLSFFFFSFLEPLLRHMEVPRLGVGSEPQQRDHFRVTCMCKKTSLGGGYDLPLSCQVTPRFQKASSDRIATRINKESNMHHR